MFVLVMAIGALIAGVGIGGRRIGWVVVGTYGFIAGAAAISPISAFDMTVSFFMAVLGLVMAASGGSARAGGHRNPRPTASDGRSRPRGRTASRRRTASRASAAVRPGPPA
jgi:peptidoglycan/LPS O-acetylase OafA/YrhL